jgi:sulfite reductase (NADPH) flavoprotein alpha-component
MAPAQPSKRIKSVCPYCGVGCGIVMEVQEGRITKVSGDKSHPTNFGRLCTKGEAATRPSPRGPGRQGLCKAGGQQRSGRNPDG